METDHTLDDAFFRYLNFLRGSELLGVQFLLRMSRLVRDSTVLESVHRHLADEARHARLWANVIVDLGGRLQPQRAFQLAFGDDLPPPRGVVDVLALNILVEQRALRSYQWHAGRERNHPRIQRALESIMRDEEWHIEWQRDWLTELAGPRGISLEEALDRYQKPEWQAANRSFLAFYRDAFPGADLEEVVGARGTIG